MVICLERGADLHMAQLMPLPLTVSCFSKIQIGFTCLVPTHLGIPKKRVVKQVCVCVVEVRGDRQWLDEAVCFFQRSESASLIVTVTANATRYFVFVSVRVGWTQR